MIDAQTRVQFSLSLTEAQRLQGVLPWLVQALEDRPTLNDKQRQRRKTTQEAIGTLVAQLNEGLSARAAATEVPHENGTAHPE
jgi:hypothetical protein